MTNTEKPKITQFAKSCYFVANHYGFIQKRILNEDVCIPTADKNKDLQMKHVLVPEDKRYGKSTKYLAIDCEMDHISPSIAHLNMSGGINVSNMFQTAMQGCNVPVKITVVNESGLIVLDTLIRPTIDGVDDKTDLTTVQNYKSQETIHGIKRKWLNDAPSLESVRDHINELCGKRELTPDVAKEDSQN